MKKHITSALDSTYVIDGIRMDLTPRQILKAASVSEDVPGHVEENAELVFSVEYADADGETRTASSAPVAIRIARGGVRPASATDAEPFGGQSVKPRGSSMYLIMLIAAGVLLIVLVVALLFSSRRARKARRQRRAQLKQRQKEELGKTNRFTPVKRPDRNRGKGE